jgi:hypothetical protein
MNGARIPSQLVRFNRQKKHSSSKGKMEMLTPMKAEQARKWFVHRWC